MHVFVLYRRAACVCTDIQTYVCDTYICIRLLNNELMNNCIIYMCVMCTYVGIRKCVYIFIHTHVIYIYTHTVHIATVCIPTDMSVMSAKTERSRFPSSIVGLKLRGVYRGVGDRCGHGACAWVM